MLLYSSKDPWSYEADGMLIPVCGNGSIEDTPFNKKCSEVWGQTWEPALKDLHKKRSVMLGRADFVWIAQAQWPYCFVAANRFNPGWQVGIHTLRDIFSSLKLLLNDIRPESVVVHPALYEGVDFERVEEVLIDTMGDVTELVDVVLFPPTQAAPPPTSTPTVYSGSGTLVSVMCNRCSGWVRKEDAVRMGTKWWCEECATAFAGGA